jgi:hypothetical protein
MLEQVEAGELVQDLKMNILQAIQFIIPSWNEITAETIQHCWNHTKILSNNIFSDEIYKDDLMLDNELTNAIEALNLPNRMQLKEFLTISEEDIVCGIPNLSEIADLFRKKPNENDLNEMDDSTEAESICINKALQSLKTVHMFLLQQENASEQIRLVSKIEKFMKKEKINLI